MKTKSPEKEYLVIYAWQTDSAPKLKWATEKELKTTFNQRTGIYRERIVIEGGTLLSDTLTEL